MTEEKFNREFRARLRAMRVAHGWTQEQMADALQIPVERYAKYEKRSKLPIYLIPQVALLMGETVEYVVTGRNRKRPKLAVAIDNSH